MPRDKKEGNVCSVPVLLLRGEDCGGPWIFCDLAFDIRPRPLPEGSHGKASFGSRGAESFGAQGAGAETGRACLVCAPCDPAVRG
ncbi:UNVERIFIED_CONTAM: hypothetical protein HHA_297480 [Hammondia hammondi]|eukprot:XP_008886104.1 hypothetical protein HHA_297480 [Hammondia hammondi]